MMSLQLFINLLFALVIGWIGHVFYVRVKFRLKARRPVVVPPGESGAEQYQRHKEARKLEPIEPPPGTPPESAERFKKLSPLVQHQVVEARKRLGLSG